MGERGCPFVAMVKPEREELKNEKEIYFNNCWFLGRVAFAGWGFGVWA
jgi:hypothetical protein